MTWNLQGSDVPARRSDWVSTLMLGLVLLVAAGVVLASLLSARPAPAPAIRTDVTRISWLDQPQAALAQAQELNKPLLVRFVADWCGVCKALDRETLSNPQVAAAVQEGFVPLSINVTDPGSPASQFANQYMIQYLPTLLILDATGRERARASGMMTPSEFLQWLAS